MSRKPKQPEASQQESESSRSLDIHELGANAKENVLKTDLLRLESKAVALSMTIDQLLAKLESKEEEITHLKQLLMAGTPAIGEPSKLITSDEEVIANLQLDILKRAAYQRDLTLDEIRKFDLLVKNKRLAQGNATTINVDKLPKDTPKDRLMQIALKKIEPKGDNT